MQSNATPKTSRLLLLNAESMLSILYQVDTVQHLGRMACTAHAILKQIQANASLWTNAGKLLCGARHWPQRPILLPPGHTCPMFVFDDPRYLTMTRVCPWLAAPRRIELGILHDIRVFGGDYSFRTLDVKDHICRLTVRMSGGGLMADGPRQSLLIRTDAYGTTNRFNTASPLASAWRSIQPTPREQALLEELRRTGWRPKALYIADIVAVRVVHDGLLCVLAHDDSSASGMPNSTLYFVSARTRSVLYAHKLHVNKWRNMDTVFFRPGEIWIYEDHHQVPTLTFFTPNREHALNSTTSDRGRRDAFWAMARGEAELSLQILRKHHTDAAIYGLRENGRSLVEAAIANDDDNDKGPKALSLLLEQLPGFRRAQFLYQALNTGKMSMARHLLEHGVDPAADDSEALRCVIMSTKGSLDMFDLLVEKGATPRPCCLLPCVHPLTPIEIVTCRLLPMMAPQRLPHCNTHHSGQDEGDEEEPPLFIDWLLNGDCFAHHMRAVAEICPEMVHARSRRHNWTPLMLAAGTLDPDNVKCLLALKADVNARDNARHSALDWCLAAGASVIPSWYSEVYYDQDAPACYTFGDEQRVLNAELIHGLLVDAGCTNCI